PGPQHEGRSYTVDGTKSRSAPHRAIERPDGRRPLVARMEPLKHLPRPDGRFDYSGWRIVRYVVVPRPSKEGPDASPDPPLCRVCAGRRRRAAGRRRTPRRYRASFTACDAGAVSYASTWEAIQNTIFARHDCANVLCHGGATPQGGLDLRPDVAYKNLVQVASTELPSLSRVAPGDE